MRFGISIFHYLANLHVFNFYQTFNECKCYRIYEGKKVNDEFMIVLGKKNDAFIY